MYIGDRPVEPFIIPVPDDISPTDYPLLSAAVRTPTGEEIGPLFAEYGVDEDDTPAVIVDALDTDLDDAGLYAVVVTASTASLERRRLPRLLFPVEDDSSGWHTTDSAREEWPTEGTYTDVQLYRLLAAAKTQCVDYAPTLAEGEPVPMNWADAQLMQARNIANAAKTDPGSSADGELFVIRPYSMDKFVKNLLRPPKAVPVIG